MRAWPLLRELLGQDAEQVRNIVWLSPDLRRSRTANTGVALQTVGLRRLRNSLVRDDREAGHTGMPINDKKSRAGTLLKHARVRGYA